MKFQLILLFAITVQVCFTGRVKWTKIEFPVKVLTPDLHAISQYFEKFDNAVPAYINWPNSISFRVQMSDGYLKIDGIFQSKRFTRVTDYDGLYYKNQQFYTKTKKKGSMNTFAPNNAVYYVQPAIRKEKPYISITYIDVHEIEDEIVRFYGERWQHWDAVLKKCPAVFLTTLSENTEGHFLEYTFDGEIKLTEAADRGLRVLIGKVSNEKVPVMKLSDNSAASRPVFYPTGQERLAIPQNALDSKPLQNVFGVRMASIGFLAEIREFRGRMLSSDDLHRETAVPIEHFIRVKDLVNKVNIVEPRFRYTEGCVPYSVPAYPMSGKFQVEGHVLVKRFNNGDGKLNTRKLFVIEYASKHSSFKVGSRTVQRLYSDELKVWVEGERNSLRPEERIFLM